MKHLTHKGYSTSVTFEADSDVFVGRLAGVSDIITFETDNIGELKVVFVEVADDYLIILPIAKKSEKNHKKAIRGKCYYAYFLSYTRKLRTC